MWSRGQPTGINVVGADWSGEEDQEDQAGTEEAQLSVVWSSSAEFNEIRPISPISVRRRPSLRKVVFFGGRTGLLRLRWHLPCPS